MCVAIKALDASNDPEIKYWPVVPELIGWYRGDVEELFNAGLVGVVEAYRSWDPSKGGLATWTHWCVRRNMAAESLSHMRFCRSRSHPRSTAEGAGWDLGEHLECLRPAIRVIFHMYYVEGCSQAEIAELVGLSKQRISQLMADGIERMSREA